MLDRRETGRRLKERRMEVSSVFMSALFNAGSDSGLETSSIGDATKIRNETWFPGDLRKQNGMMTS